MTRDSDIDLLVLEVLEQHKAGGEMALAGVRVDPVTSTVIAGGSPWTRAGAQWTPGDSAGDWRRKRVQFIEQA